MEKILLLSTLIVISLSTAKASQSTTLEAQRLIGSSLTLGDCSLESRYIKEDNYESLFVSFYWSDSEYEYSSQREYTNDLDMKILSKVVVKKRWWVGKPYAVILEYVVQGEAPADVYRITFEIEESEVVSIDYKKFRGAEWNVGMHIECSEKDK